jgi:glycosyltransferase involved in cell wall biosynthesis
LATRPLKLLLIVNRLTLAGGAEIQLGHLAVELAGLGHEVTICCIFRSYVDQGRFDDAGVKVVSLQAETRNERPRAVGSLVQLAKEADVVQCTMWDASLWGRIAAIIARRPVIVADHATNRSIQLATSGASRQRWIALHNRLLDRFTFATVICAESQREVLTAEGVDPGKIVYIPNGIPLQEITAAAAHPPSRASLGIDGDGPIVIQVGVFRPEKNQIGGIETVAALRERIPDAQLALVGDGDDRVEVEDKATALDARGWAHFVGFREDIAALFGAADLMLLPSISDALPITVLEAMTAGVPVVATDVGDVGATLGEAGICVPHPDPAELAAACATVLTDPARRERMAAVGRERSEAFGATEMGRRYADLFQRAAARERLPQPLPTV